MDISTAISSTITALQTHVGALQRSLEEQANKFRSEKSHSLAQSEKLAEIVATRDTRIEELEEQNRRQARRIEFLESKQAEADRREGAASRSESTSTALKSPDHSNPGYGGLAAHPKENAAAVAAAKAALAKRKVYFVPAPMPLKYSLQPQAERDNGKALRAMLALEKPSQVVTVDCFPGREWKLSACELPRRGTEEESAGLKGEAETDEEDQKAVPSIPEVITSSSAHLQFLMDSRC